MDTSDTGEWFADESFWEELYPFMFREPRFEMAADQMDGALALAQPAGEQVLDLCCGPGRHALELARKGFQVTGVDRTEFLLKLARDRARSEHLEIEWVREDMRLFSRPGNFDLILNMYTSFGYFERPEDDVDVLRTCRLNLKPGGVLLIDVMPKERLARIFQPTTSTSLPDGTLIIQRHEIRHDWTRVWNEWLVIRNGHVRRFEFEHTVYSGQELRDRLHTAGFEDVKLYGSLTGEPYGFTCESLVAVARRPNSVE